MRVFNLKPHPYLRSYISRYWVWENEPVLPRLLPGTGTELMFHYGQPLRWKNERGQAITVPRSHIMATRFGYYSLEPVSNMGFIAVRFRAGAFRHFCREAGHDLIDEFIDINDIWGHSGQKFGQQIIEAKTLEDRISIIEKVLMGFLEQYRRPEYWLDRAVRKVLYGYNAVSIEEVSKELCISERQMQRRFKEAVGITPKGFQRVSRFEAVMRHLLLNKEQSYLAAALEHGYYDQSHFIKECNAYVGEHPSLFLQEKNFMSHFYNKSLSR